ncbi:MAG: S41 family peptidase [Fibrobacter sp.]|nr:S41 family peptidase [Fibrobacter sp.]
MKLSKVCAAVALSLGLSFIGCSSDGSSDGINLPQNQWDPEDGTYTQEEIELLFNNELLGLFYMEAKNELKDADAYMGKGSTSSVYSKSACTGPYVDVCYMYEQLSDNFTRYFDPNYAAQILSLLTESESAVGVGIQVELTPDGSIVITEVWDNSPASGLLSVGDTIVSVDGTTPTSISAFDKLVSGDEGDKIVFEIRNEKEIMVAVTLGEFLAPTVYLDFVDSIPVVRITEFTEETSSDSGTYGEFMSMAKKINDYKSMVVDLRGNPGGDVSQCSNIAAEFLSKNDTIITLVETNVDSTVKHGVAIDYFQILDTTTYIASENGVINDKYVVFLADENSASCAEILLAAVTAQNKTPVVGKTTYGKGIGQMVMTTYADGLALITGLKMIDKNGDSYHKMGIEPDHVITDADEQLKTAVDIAKEASEKRVAGYGKVPTGNFKKVKALGPLGIPASKADFYNLLTGPYTIKNFKK